MFTRFIVAAIGAVVAVPSAVAQQQQQKQAQPQKVQQQPRVPKGKPEPTGPKLRHQCKVGPYEKQTRLVMETVRDKPVYLAYWSSNGPFHCSFESWPGDGRAKWMDSSAGTVINLISGTMLIERTSTGFLVHARDVDRMPYCGTFGLINGILTVPVRKGTDCNWTETTPEEAGRLNPDVPEAPAAPPGPTTEAPSAPAIARTAAP